MLASFIPPSIHLAIIKVYLTSFYNPNTNVYLSNLNIATITFNIKIKTDAIVDSLNLPLLTVISR